MRNIALVAVMALAAGSQAVTFTNVQINSAPYSNNSSWQALGNAIKFFTPNAIITNGSPTSSTVLSIQYDADAGAGNLFNAIQANISAIQLGSGNVAFFERAIELDSGGNEIGGIIGSISNPSFASSFNFNGSSSLTKAVRWVRIKKDIILSAPDDPQTPIDLAAVSINNQALTVVPEPATMTALGLGLAAMLRRRKK